MKNNHSTWWQDYFCLALLIGFSFFYLLGCRALSVPDEARYSEIPREMLQMKDFITPHLNGIIYFEKPPLLYWFQAAAIYLFGKSEWVLRAPTALLGVLGCLTTYGVGRYLFNRRTGLLAAIILASSNLYFAMAHSITLDMTVSVFLTMTLFAFLCAVETPVGDKRRRYFAWWMYASAALAVLSKGLIGIFLPGLVIFVWLLVFNRWRELKNLYLISGIIVFLIIALPWHIAVQIKNPEFFHFYFVEQHFTRYLTKAMGRYKPWWWFLPIFIAGFFPWICFFPQAIKQAWQSGAKGLFLILWWTLILVFFSLSDSKLIPYILPIMPATALLVANYFDLKWATPKNLVDKISCVIAALFALALAIVLWQGAKWANMPEASAEHYLHLMAGLMFFLMLLSLPCYYLKGMKGIFFFWCGLNIIFLWTLVAAMPTVDTRPIKPLALLIKEKAKPTDIVVSYGVYYQDLPFYLDRLVYIVNWQNELSFGYEHQANAKEWMIDDSKFLPMWKSSKRVYAIMDQDDYQRLKKDHRVIILGRKADNVAVTNHD